MEMLGECGRCEVRVEEEAAPCPRSMMIHPLHIFPVDGYTYMFRFYSKNPSKASIDNVDVVVVVENEASSTQGSTGAGSGGSAKAGGLSCGGSDRDQEELKEVADAIQRNRDNIVSGSFFRKRIQSSSGGEWEVDYRWVGANVFFWWYVWCTFLEEFRRKIYDKKKDKEFYYKYTSGCRFNNTLRDIQHRVSFHSVSVSFDDPHQKDELRADVATFYRVNGVHEQGWLNFLTDTLVHYCDPKVEPWRGALVWSNPAERVKRDDEGALYYHNIRVFPSYHEHSEAITGDVHKASIFDNLRGDAAWGLLLGNMLCTMNEIFLSYHNRIEKHITEREETKVMLELLRNASQDFQYFFDADVVLNPYLRNAYETAKEAFLVNEYWRRLKDRINLFSGYEIAERQRTLNEIVPFGSIVLIAITFA